MDKFALHLIKFDRSVSEEDATKIYKKLTNKKAKKPKKIGKFVVYRYLPKTKFEPKSLQKRVLENCTIVYGKLKIEHHKLEGSGIFDYFKKTYDYVKNKVVDAFDYVKHAVSINDFSEKTKNNLSKYGNYNITAIQIRRVPIAFAIDLALQGLSAGKWDELKTKYGFDKFFHLSIVVTLNINPKSKQLAIEKLEVVSVNENIDLSKEMETLDVLIPANKVITINNLFQKAREKVGDTKFFAYSALGQNNCQDFIKLLLEVEDLYNEPEKDFVYQDMTELIKELPQSTIAVSQATTHLGALANKYLNIGGNKKITLNDLYKKSKIKNKISNSIK